MGAEDLVFSLHRGKNRVVFQTSIILYQHLAHILVEINQGRKGKGDRKQRGHFLNSARIR